MTPTKCQNPKCKAWFEIGSAESVSCPGCGLPHQVVANDAQLAIQSYAEHKVDSKATVSCEHGRTQGEKCDECGIMYVEEVPRPYGGATSFQGADDFLEAQEREMHVEQQERVFELIFTNIMATEEVDLAEKARLVQQAAVELGSRVREDPTGQRSASEPSGVVSRVRALLARRLGKDVRSAQRALQQGAFYVTKDFKGNLRWVAIVSNKYYDREGEVFPESAHKEHERWLDRTKRYPEARLWHTPGSRFGMCDFWTYADGFVITSGTFDKGMEDVAARLKEAGSSLGVSHGFYYPDDAPDAEGIYRFYRMFEISPLPRQHAANLWTEFSVPDGQKEAHMPITKEKRRFLEEYLGPARVSAIEGHVEGLSKELAQAGIGWKALGDALDDGGGGAPATTEEDNEDDEDDEETAATDPATTTEPPAGEPVGDDAAEEPTEEASTEGALKELLVAVKGIGSKLGGIEGRLTALEQSDDDKIASHMAPRNGKAKVAASRRPSQSAETKIDEELGKDVASKSGAEGAVEGHPADRYVDDLIGGRVLQGQ